MKKISKKRIVIYIILAILVLFGAFKFMFYDTKKFENIEYLTISIYHGDDEYYHQGTRDLKTIKSGTTKQKIKNTLKQQLFVRTWKKAERSKEKAIILKVKIEDSIFNYRVYKAKNNKSIIVIDKKSFKINNIWNDLYDILMEDSKEDILEYNVKHYWY